MLSWLLRLRRLWFAALFALSGALGLMVSLAGVASAHASYVSSDPAAGAVVATAPTQVTVHFAENINPQGANGVKSSLTVWHEQDATTITSFDEEAKQVSPEKGTQYPLSDAKTMTISLQGDGDGIYAVSWFTVSADDGEADRGVFFFGVGTGNVLGTGTGPASTTPTASTTPSSGTPLWVTILVGMVALVLGGGIGAGLRRRPQAAGADGSNAPLASPPRDTPGEKR